MIIQHIVKPILFILVIIQITSPLQKSTPLRLDDIQSEEIYVRLDTNDFKLFIYISHFATQPNIYFCFRQRTVTSAKNNVCDLTGVFNPYKCIEIIASVTNGVLTTISASVFDSDSTLTSINKSNLINLSSNFITNGSSQVGIIFTSYVSENKIYEVYAGYRPDLRNDPIMSKNAFFNTFKIANQTSSDDLMAQRHPHCFQFYYQNYINYNLIFYGGTVRGTNQTMFFHVLTYFTHPNNSIAIGSNLNGYIGISWSRNHANRDMAAFITANSTLFDLFSLYYSAPYLDESIHIIGTSDILTVTDSSLYTGGQLTHYYYGGFARLYDTLDAFGDELIRKKMNNTYCIAVGFHNLNNTFPYSPLSAGNKHLDHGCFTSTVILSGIMTTLSVIITISLILI